MFIVLPIILHSVPSTYDTLLILNKLKLESCENQELCRNGLPRYRGESDTALKSLPSRSKS
jgi:hypothetical protein